VPGKGGVLPLSLPVQQIHGAVVVIASRYFASHSQAGPPVSPAAPKRASTMSRRLSGMKRRLVAPGRKVSEN
jgi:hypothetical protein